MHPMPCTYNGRTFPVLCVSVSVKAIYQWPALSIDARVALHEKHLSINSVVSATKDPFFAALAPRHCVFVAFLRKYPFSPRKKAEWGFPAGGFGLSTSPSRRSQFSFTLRCPHGTAAWQRTRFDQLSSAAWVSRRIKGPRPGALASNGGDRAKK